MADTQNPAVNGPQNPATMFGNTPSVSPVLAPAVGAHNYIDPKVADLDPSVYAAAAVSPLNQQQANQLNQIAGTMNMYKKLSALPEQQAKEQYKKLAPEAQDMIKSVYGAVPFTNTDNLFMQVVKNVGKVALSTANPLVALFKTGTVYNKALNFAPNVEQDVLLGKDSVFNTNTYKKAWDGTALFDNAQYKDLVTKYGAANAAVAVGTLKGETPGQILDSYGKVDDNILGAVASLLGNTPQFDAMITEFHNAQLSPGRDLARNVMGNNPMDQHLGVGNNKFGIAARQFETQRKAEGAPSGSEFSAFSGTVDAFYQLLHDPLTYLSGGLDHIAPAAGELADKVMPNGARLAQKLYADAETRSGNVDAIFARPEIQSTWNDKYGPLIRKVAEADKARDPEAKAAAMKQIEINAPDINNRSLIKLLSQAEVFDAPSAARFTKTLKGAQEMVYGLVDGSTFSREGIPLARKSRFVTAGLNRVLGDVFNGDIPEEIAAQIGGKGIGKAGIDALEAIGRNADPVEGQIPKSELLDELRGHMALRNRIARLAQTHPGYDVINVMDDNVDKTIPVLKRNLRLIYPRWAAEPIAEAFTYATPADRINILRGLYTQIMQSMNVPEDTIRAVLEDKFADTTKFSVGKDIMIPPQHLGNTVPLDILEHQSEEEKGGLFKTVINGPIHPFQSKPFIGSIPWNDPTLISKGLKGQEKVGLARSIHDGVGGISRSFAVRRMTNVWATGSIFPRMGMRGTIEQATFHILTAPLDNIIYWSKGRKLNKLTIAFTGAEENIPFFQRQLRNVFDINPAKWIPEKSVYDQGGELVKQGRFNKTGIVNGQEIWQAAQPLDVIYALDKKIKALFPDEVDQEIAKSALRHPSGQLYAEHNSVIARSAMAQGIKGGVLDEQILSKQGVARMLKALDYKATGAMRLVKPDDLLSLYGEQALSAAHYRFWFPRFRANYLADGTNVGAVFIRNNALRTGEDFANARDTILSHIGVDPETKKVTDAAKLKQYLDDSMQSAVDTKVKGWSEVDSAINRIQHSLWDMYESFHGGPLAFNDTLYNHIRDVAMQYKDVSKMGTNKAIGKALDTIEYDNFEELTRQFRPTREFKTDLDLDNPNIKSVTQALTSGDVAPFLAAMKRFGEGGIQNKMLHWMDTQINQMFNQPAFRVAYVTIRKQVMPWQREMAERLINSGWNKDTAEAVADRHFHEYAEKQASESVVKFIDSATKQSNLAWSLRTAGRFFRAQEQFLRRVWRLKDYMPRALYRARLVNLGLDNLGFIHKDAQGNAYFTMPGDSILYHAINGTLNKLLGRNDIVTEPMFSDFNMNIIQSSPSLGPDAGVPSLSGPFLSIPILGLKQLFKNLPWAWSQEASTKIDTMMLGNNSANLTPSKLLPTVVQRALDALPKSEQDHQLASAAMMAISYNAANNAGLTPEEAKILNAGSPATGMSVAYLAAADKYIKNIKVTANNVLFLRALIGMVSPISPTMVEDKGVSDFLKNEGISSLSQEFADLLGGVLRNDQGVQDPYEVALAAFTRDYPGRSVFAVSRNDKSTQLLASYTDQTQQWMLANNKWLNSSTPGVGTAAMVFAPNVGQYDPNVYVWMQSQGLIKQKQLGQYLQDVVTAQDVQYYHSQKALQTYAVTHPNEMIGNLTPQQVIQNSTANMAAIKLSNPMVTLELEDSSTAIQNQKTALAGLGYLVNNKDFPMSAGVRDKMSVAYNLVNNAVNAMSADTAANGQINSGLNKANLKQQVLDALEELGGGTGEGNTAADAQIAEATRSIFAPLLDNLSNTTVKPGSVITK